MAEMALEMRQVSVVKDGCRILDSVNIDIAQGENVAIIGLNGSGKSTLIKLLTGDIHPYYDETNPSQMKIFGEEQWNIFDVRSKMGVVSMDLQSQFGPGTLVSEVIASGFFGSMDVFRNMTVTEDMVKKVYEMAYKMGIDHLLGRTIEGLSLGEMRRTVIARALITSPKMLVLDEPMTGLDIVMRSKFRMMFDILIDSGVNIVMITHDLADIPDTIDRIIMMKDGKVFADGNKKDLLDSKTISELYGEPIKVECTKGAYRMYLCD